MAQHALSVPTCPMTTVAAAEVQLTEACAEVDTAFCIPTTGMYTCK